jgi:hypothetical protein
MEVKVEELQNLNVETKYFDLIESKPFYFCCQCKGILKNPQSCATEGFQYCKDCVVNDKCPSCTFGLIPNVELALFIGAVKMKCKACEAEVLKREAATHVEICDKMISECDGASLGCSNKQIRSLIVMHQQVCIFSKHKKLTEQNAELKKHREILTTESQKLLSWKQNVVTKLSIFYQFTKKKERYEVSVTGRYRIIAVGADGTSNKKHLKYIGGKGTEMQASFFLSKGDKLDLIVGESLALDTLGNGGGGSFVFLVGAKESLPLIVAGGGGAAWKYNGNNGKKKSRFINSTPKIYFLIRLKFLFLIYF